jgi:Mg2+ and Co2+ transporter CorA
MTQDARTLAYIERNVAIKSPNHPSQVTTSSNRDAKRMSIQLRALGRSTIDTRYHMRVITQLLTLIVRTNRSYRKNTNLSDSEIVGSEELMMHVEALQNHVDLDADFVMSNAESVNNQMSAIFNHINMQDSLVSIQIARDGKVLATESKRDSSSMKTIAAVTMAFLPGTFVASFFAMPMFNWQAASTHQVVSPRVWIYWAVTIPLTTLTFVAWWGWFLWKSMKETRENEKAQQTLFQDDIPAKHSLHSNFPDRSLTRAYYN